MKCSVGDFNMLFGRKVSELPFCCNAVVVPLQGTLAVADQHFPHTSVELALVLTHRLLFRFCNSLPGVLVIYGIRVAHHYFRWGCDPRSRQRPEPPYP